MGSAAKAKGSGAERDVVKYLKQWFPYVDMTTYTITAQVDQQWFDILGQITRNQDGFVWETVEELTNA